MPYRNRGAVILAVAALLVTAVAQADPPPRVVVSILPLHGLVSGVTEGVTEPALLLTSGHSPHSYTMRPSEARHVANADLIVWTGPGLERFLAAAIEARSDETRIIEAIALPDIHRRGSRDGEHWDHGQAHGHGHGEHEIDYHLWLDTGNARRIVEAVARALAELDPGRAEMYLANARAVKGRLDTLDQDLAALLAPVRDVPYVVFHDAYQYFEARYGLSPAGAVTVHPGQPPGARRLRELRRLIRDLEAVCVFSEPQFEPAIVATLIRGTEARRGELDPLGIGIEPGPEAYFELMERLAESFLECLS